MASAQTQEGRAGVGGATSPLGPDSTWAGAEAGDIAGAKMEARFAQLEQRLLQDSEERFKLMEHHMIMMLKNIQKTNEFCETIVKREDSQSAKTQQYLEKFLPLLENDMNLTKTLENMQEKIDLLLGGENEANKLIDSIAPNVEKTRSDMKKKWRRNSFTKLIKVMMKSRKLEMNKKVIRVTSEIYCITRKEVEKNRM